MMGVLMGGALLGQGLSAGTCLLVLFTAALITLDGRGRTDLYHPPLDAALALNVAMVGVYAWLITQGGGSWSAQEVHGAAYDSLALHMLEGSIAVDPAALGNEAWLVNGQTYMYFGPLPALLRVAVLWLWPQWQGCLSRFSCWLAVVVALGGMSRMCRWALANRVARSGTGAGALYGSSMVALAMGSPLTVVGSLANLYQEAIVWGLAAAMWGLYFALRALHDPREQHRALFGLSVAAGAALLARVTFGTPIYALLVLCTLHWFSHLPRPQRRAALVTAAKVMAPAFAAGCMQLAYNAARFGSVFNVADFSVYRGAKPVGLPWPIHVLRVPSSVVAYFGVWPENFSSHAPFVLFVDKLPLEPVYFHRRTTPLLSPLLSAPYLSISMTAGLKVLWQSPRRGWLAAATVPLVIQLVLIMGYYWLGYRYMAELLPLLVWLHALFLTRAPPAVLRVWLPLVAVAVLVTALASVDFHHRWWTYSRTHKNAAGHLIKRMDAWVHPSD